MRRKEPNIHFEQVLMKHHQKHKEFHRHMEELRRQHEKHHKGHEEFHRRHQEFHRYHRYLKNLRPVILIFNIGILYLLFWWVGFKAIGIIFAVFLVIKEFAQLFFYRRLEKRIFEPIEKLKNGVKEISSGNYNVKVECEIPNEIGLLVKSFNEMAQKLSESEKMKTEYEENRKTLIANISHDLKTPITSIQGYIEAILEGAAVPQENMEKYLQIIYRNSAYMNKLIDDLFLFSKLDMQKLDFQFEKIQIRAFMNDLMEEFKFELEEKQFQFQYTDKLQNDVSVLIDRKRINQAIRNIIGNAVKHGREEGVSIHVEMNQRNESIYIDIKDNGPGIPQDKLPYIFDRFYRIDNERTKDLMSTGLGLAIAKELIEAHGGSIKVSSEEKEGTCFTILLPMIKL